MYIRGKKAILTFLKGGEYLPFRCTTDCAITINTETVQVRTIGDGVWAKPRGARQSYTLSMTGLIELTETEPVTFWLIENYVMQMLPVPFRLIFDDPVTSLRKLVTGEAIIKTATTTGVPVGFATGAFEMEGVGAPVITDSSSICNATIGELSYGSTETPGEVLINYDGVANAARLEYSVDGGPREVVFSPGSAGSFTVSGLSDGTHTIQVFAVCESGVDGESNELIFEVTGGEPAPNCAAPGAPVMSLIGTTTATGTWAAASPVPAGGYRWELVNNNTSLVVQNNDTTSTSVNLTDLLPGVSYTFRVKSLCEVGVSESSFQSVTFETFEVCNVPGSPVMSAVTSTTATATWTAPTPAPGSGYGWQVIQGISTVIDSGTTSALSVNLTGLPSGTLLTFRVKSICAVGNESGYNSVSFGTDEAVSNIDWALIEDLGNGTLVIDRAGVEIVNETTAGVGNFTATAGQLIEIALTAVSGQVTVDDLTSSTQIVNVTDSGTTNGSFTVVEGHNYSITATVLS